MCSPPKPSAINPFPQLAGSSSAIVPNNMKHRPITGTIRTEKEPAATMPAPKSSIHMPGSCCTTPSLKSTAVSTPPATTTGARLSAIFRPGPDSSAIPAARAFQVTDNTPITSAMSASPVQTEIHISTEFALAAIRAAPSAVTPIADFNEHFGSRLPAEDYDTIGGLVTATIGHVPAAGEVIQVDDFHFQIAKADDRRVHQLRLHIDAGSL